MSEIEDQLRAYADAVARAQRPVALGDVVERRPRRPRRLVALVAAAVAAVVAVAVVAVTRPDGSGTKHVVVAPGATSTALIPPAPRDCPAASLTVTGQSGETLHPSWLPAGYALSNGNEHALGANDMLEYLGPRASDRPYVEISRRHSALPPDQLVSGTDRPVTVNGHAGVASIGIPDPLWENIAWTEAPGTVLIVTGHLVPEGDLLRVADGLEYDPGSPFAYPAHPDVSVTREQALATLGHGPVTDARGALTSYGEIDALAAGTGPVNHVPVLAPDVAVTQPVWVVWSSDVEGALVVDAETGATMVTIPHIDPGALAGITDRSQPVCAPPFGVLTRSEVAYLRPTEAGATTVLKLSTLGALDTTSTIADLAECEISTCDPSVPVWLLVESATDHRYVDRMSRPCCGPPPSSPPGSFSVTALDARTGPQTTQFGGELGPGQPPAALGAVRDLAPGD